MAVSVFYRALGALTLTLAFNPVQGQQVTPPVQVQSKTTWVEKSNELLGSFLKEHAHIGPELALEAGLCDKSFVENGSLLPGHKKRATFFKEWTNKLQLILTLIENQDLRQDLLALLHYVEGQVELEKLFAADEIPFITPVTRTIRKHLEALKLREQSYTPELIAQRFHTYVAGNPEKRHKSLTALALDALKKYSETEKNLPAADMIDVYLASVQEDMIEIQHILSSNPNTDWKKDFEQFKADVEGYVKELNAIKLRSQQPYVLSPVILQAYLNRYGVHTSPAVLLEQAESLYSSTYKELRFLSDKLSKKYKKPYSTYVLETALTTSEDVENQLKSAYTELHKLLRRHDVISEPIRQLTHHIVHQDEVYCCNWPMVTRLPLFLTEDNAPLLRLPTPKKPLSAHDAYTPAHLLSQLTTYGRPGVETIYQVGVKQKSSYLRQGALETTPYQFGWALYATSIMEPVLPEEAQFFSKQKKLLFIGRALLELQLHTQKRTFSEISKILIEEVGLSREQAEREIREMLLSPGQNLGAFAGWLEIQEASKTLKKALGVRYKPRVFRNKMLRYGFLPIEQKVQMMLQEVQTPEALKGQPSL